MLHPRLTSLDGTQKLWLAAIGDTGSWGDLTYQTRWGEGACGMYEASWTMTLPPNFEHPLLRRGTQVELMDGGIRVGNSLVMAEPTVGSGTDQPWSFTSTGLGREVEGANSLYAFRTSDGETTTVPSEAADYAKNTDGWRIAGRRASVPTAAIATTATSEELMTVGSLFNAAGASLGQRWGIDSDNFLQFKADPTTPSYIVAPESVALGTTDSDYASVVKVRYPDLTAGKYLTVTATNTQSDTRFGRKTYGVNLTAMPPMPAATAQGYADGILAMFKGRLAWTNGFTLRSDQILVAGGKPADLTQVAEDVGNGCMFRLMGIWSDLLEFTGKTCLDVVMSQAQVVDGDDTISLSPLGLAPRVLSDIVEQVTGYRDAA